MTRLHLWADALIDTINPSERRKKRRRRKNDV